MTIVDINKYKQEHHFDTKDKTFVYDGMTVKEKKEIEDNLFDFNGNKIEVEEIEARVTGLQGCYPNEIIIDDCISFEELTLEEFNDFIESCLKEAILINLNQTTVE